MLTVGITTFKHRFNTYFKPLIKQIKDNPDNKDLEIIVTINGEHNETFDENYRNEILSFLSDIPNVFPVIFPQFRGLSKLWNTLLIQSSNDYVLILNDDVSIVDENFFQNVRTAVQELNTSFQINNSFSHVVLKKSEIIYDLGGISEKLLGIGEEEYIMWRYAEQYCREMPNVNIGGIINHIDFTHAPTNVKQINNNGGKYSQLNREVMYNALFNIDNENGVRHGKIPVGLIYKPEEHPHQYPNERYYIENKDKL